MDAQLTRCPHCQACFTVEESELNYAYGVVRCGACLKIFNASHHLFELEYVPEGALPEEIAPKQPSATPKMPSAAPVQNQTEHRIPEPEPHQPPEVHLVSEPDHSSHPEVDDDKSSSQKFSLIDQPWLPVAVGLSLLILVVLMVVGNTRMLSQHPSMSGLVDGICSITGCDHPVMSDFEHLVYSQAGLIPESPNRIQIDFVLENPGTMTVRFPAILVFLQDATGETLVEHLVQPDDYLAEMPFSDNQLPSDLPVAITLSLDTQGYPTESFDLIFMPPLNP